jgi:hypothetical protein
MSSVFLNKSKKSSRGQKRAPATRPASLPAIYRLALHGIVYWFPFVRMLTDPILAPRERRAVHTVDLYAGPR